MRFSRLIILATVSIFIFPFMVGLSSTAAQAQTVRWRQIIGIIDPGNVVGVGTPGKVTGAGQPWSARQGTARVKLGTGDLHFRVRGLVLAGGGPAGDAPIGTNPAPTVRGTLVCDIDGSAGGKSILVNTAPVPMSAQGDASIDTNLGPLPAACDEPDIAFLIRIVMGPGPWIANGAVRIP